MTKPAISVSGEHADMQLPRCPNCGAAIEMHATVEAWLEPREWEFYGLSGQRWIKCRSRRNEYDYIHFVAQVNGRRSNRIAWIRVADTEPTVGQPALF